MDRAWPRDFGLVLYLGLSIDVNKIYFLYNKVLDNNHIMIFNKNYRYC